MKKTALLLTSLAGGMLLFSSYSLGPSNIGAGNRTGSPGSGGTCGGGGCHAAPSGSTQGIFGIIEEKATGNTVTNFEYTPGMTYIVNFGGGNLSLSKFGFQVIALNSANTEIGTMTASQANTHVGNGFTALVEHSLPLDATVGAFVGEFEWTAPAAGAGDVTFYGIINAVNGTGSASGDQPSQTFNVTLSEGTTSIDEFANNAVFAAYPNPVQDALHISFKSKAQYNVQVYDASGRLQFRTATDGTTLNTPTQSWASGLYFVSVAKGGKRQVLQVSKW